MKVETQHGERIVWGIDLGRAVAASGIAIGKRAAVEKVGNTPVTTNERGCDNNGK